MKETDLGHVKSRLRCFMRTLPGLGFRVGGDGPKQSGIDRSLSPRCRDGHKLKRVGFSRSIGAAPWALPLMAVRVWLEQPIQKFAWLLR